MDMRFVKGRRANLQSVGWQDHILQVEFKGGRVYRFGGVERSVYETLLRVPFPDKYFSTAIRGKYVSERVDTPPSKKLPEMDMDLLPF